MILNANVHILYNKWSTRSETESFHQTWIDRKRPLRELAQRFAFTLKPPKYELFITFMDLKHLICGTEWHIVTFQVNMPR